MAQGEVLYAVAQEWPAVVVQRLLLTYFGDLYNVVLRFRFVCLKFGDRVFYRSGILGMCAHMFLCSFALHNIGLSVGKSDWIIFQGKELPWSSDKQKFEQWAQGRTGVPFVDANVRELKVLYEGCSERLGH